MTTSELDLGPAQQAVDVAAAYPRAIHLAAIDAQGVALGPWQLAVSCKYGTSDRNTYSLSRLIDVTKIRTSLQATLSDAETQAGTFLGTFAVVPTWMRTSLPATAQAFAAAMATVDTAVGAARAGTLTPQLVAATVADLQAVADLLQAGSDDLTAGMQGLATFATEQQGYTDRIGTVTASLTAEVEGAFASTQQQLVFAPCGGDDGQRQLTAMRSRFADSSATFARIFSDLAKRTVATQQAVSLLIGTVLSFVNEYRPVIAQVQRADAATTASTLQALHLEIASVQWQRLADHASRQLHDQRAALAADLTTAATAAANIVSEPATGTAASAAADTAAFGVTSASARSAGARSADAAESDGSPLGVATSSAAAVDRALQLAYGAP